MPGGVSSKGFVLDLQVQKKKPTTEMYSTHKQRRTACMQMDHHTHPHAAIYMYMKPHNTEVQSSILHLVRYKSGQHNGGMVSTVASQ